MWTKNPPLKIVLKGKRESNERLQYSSGQTWMLAYEKKFMRK